MGGKGVRGMKGRKRVEEEIARGEGKGGRKGRGDGRKEYNGMERR